MIKYYDYDVTHDCRQVAIGGWPWGAATDKRDENSDTIGNCDDRCSFVDQRRADDWNDETNLIDDDEDTAASQHQSDQLYSINITRWFVFFRTYDGINKY